MAEYDVVVIGSGPAGISAALYAVRAGMKTAVITKGGGSLEKAHEIENYYGFEEPVSGTELLRRGIAQAKRLGVDVIEAEVVGIEFAEKLSVCTKEQCYPADCIVLAMGASRAAPPIPKLKEYEGRGVSYCAMCDAFFYRGKQVGVIGEGEYAVHEASELANTSGGVTILTNGKEPTCAMPENFRVEKRKILRVVGEGTVSGVELEGGEILPVEGLFVAMGVAGSAEIARKIGAPVENNKIIVDANQSTGIAGVYAAGDCTGGLLQVAKAVYEGAKAGTEAVKHIKAMRK